MATISVISILSQGVHLKYPFSAVIESCLGLAREFIINVDMSVPDDGTITRLEGLKAQYEINLQIVPTYWDWTKSDSGQEFARQTNVGINHATSDWVLCLQADEIIHQDDFDEIRWITKDLPQQFGGAELLRLCFWKDFQTLRKDWTIRLARLFRRGRGYSIGDSCNCFVDGMVWPISAEGTPRIFHYSRVGTPEIIASRIQANDRLHHPSDTVASGGEYDFGLRSFDSYAEGTKPEPRDESVLVKYRGTHPKAAERWFSESVRGS